MKRAFLISLFFCVAANAFAQQKHVLSFDKLKTYVNSFNKTDTETVKNYITNDHAYDWLAKNVPLFECPDSAIQKIYYYRWWTFRKHLKQTPDGFIFTEFITPVTFTGVYNSSSSALGHQVYEGGGCMILNILTTISNSGSTLIKAKKPHFHAFSSWIDDAVYNYYLVTTIKIL
jgi:hypothetical protein